MDKIDKRIKRVWNKLYKPIPGSKKGNCPGDKLLSCYSDGLLEGDDKRSIEEHLLACHDCLDLILLSKRVKREEAHGVIPDTPTRLIERAISLLPERGRDVISGLFDVVLRFAKDSIEIISNPGSLSISYGPVPVPVRGKETLSTNLIYLNKDFSEVESEIEIERAGTEHLDIKVITKSVVSGKPEKGLRVGLFKSGREIASSVAENGEVRFTGLEFGEYAIKITRLGKEVGQISLSLKE